MEETVITITGRKLAQLLAPVVPLADGGGSLPILNAVNLRGHGDHLTATATDRYRMGVQRVRVSAPAGWSAIVPLDVVKLLLRTYKPTRGSDPELTLTFEQHSFTVETGSLGLTVESSRIGYRLIDSTYPKVGKVLADAFKGDGVPVGTSVNASFLAGFAAAAGHGVLITLYGSARSTRSGRKGSPIGIAAGDDFRGVLMTTYEDVAAAPVAPMTDEWLALTAEATDATAEEKAS